MSSHLKFERRSPWPPLHSIQSSIALLKNACNACAGAQHASTRASQTILPKWHNPSAFATSARQYVGVAQPCCREIRGLRISFAASARTSVMPVQTSAENTTMSKLCGNVPKRAVAVLRRAGRLPNLVPFERLRRTQQVVERFSEADCKTRVGRNDRAPRAPQPIFIAFDPRRRHGRCLRSRCPAWLRFCFVHLQIKLAWQG